MKDLLDLAKQLPSLSDADGISPLDEMVVTL